MFEYFPGNYVWNLSVVATLNNGGLIDEVDRACRPLLEAARAGSDAGTEQMYASWSAVADQLISSAEDDEKRGRLIGAGAKYMRASNYVSQAERMQSPHWEGRNAAYQRSIDLLAKGAELAGANFRASKSPTRQALCLVTSSRLKGRTASRRHASSNGTVWTPPRK